MMYIAKGSAQKLRDISEEDLIRIAKKPKDRLVYWSWAEEEWFVKQNPLSQNEDKNELVVVSKAERPEELREDGRVSTSSYNSRQSPSNSLTWFSKCPRPIREESRQLVARATRQRLRTVTDYEGYIPTYLGPDISSQKAKRSRGKNRWKRLNIQTGLADPLLP